MYQYKGVPVADTPMILRPGMKDHCMVGHPLFGDNLYLCPVENNRMRRVCKACRKVRAARYRAKRKAEQSATTRSPTTT